MHYKILQFFLYVQVIAFIEALLRNKNSTKIFRVAIIVPVNTLDNWKNELEKWIPEGDRPRVSILLFKNVILMCIYMLFIDLSSSIL